jgi:hypothetical protein
LRFPELLDFFIGGDDDDCKDFCSVKLPEADGLILVFIWEDLLEVVGRDAAVASTTFSQNTLLSILCN